MAHSDLGDRIANHSATLVSRPSPCSDAIFFSRVIHLTFFSFLLIYGGLGLQGWDLGQVFGIGVSVDGVRGMWCEAFWVFFGVGALYINIEE